MFTIMKKWMVATLLLVVAQQVAATEVMVSAAASLTNAFKEVGAAYETKYPGAKVSLNFGASGALQQQIAKGAPVDVFASADQATMDLAQKEGQIIPEERKDFVRNTLVLILPMDSKLVPPKQLSDLTQEGITRISLGNPATTPAGRYAQRAMEKADVWAKVESKLIMTQNVRQSLDYVVRGEVDTGFVFGTDAAIMPDKAKIAFEVPLDEKITYPVAMTSNNKVDSEKGKEAKRFIDFLLSDEGQTILGKYGFAKP
jgi:molybdenum ABC transporter, periplasmic molybdate-binding protein